MSNPLLVDRLLPSSSLCLSVVADVIGGRTSSYFFQHIIITTSLGFTQHRLISSPLSCHYMFPCFSIRYLLYTYQSLFALGSSHNNTGSRDMSSLCLRFFFPNRVLVSITVLQFLYFLSPPSLESRLELDHSSVAAAFHEVVSHVKPIGYSFFMLFCDQLNTLFLMFLRKRKKQRKPKWKRIKCFCKIKV